jgi:hypothetical protein
VLGTIQGRPPSRSVPLQSKKRRKTLSVCAPCHRDVLRKLDRHDRAELSALTHEIQLIKSGYTN